MAVAELSPSWTVPKVFQNNWGWVGAAHSTTEQGPFFSWFREGHLQGALSAAP